MLGSVVPQLLYRRHVFAGELLAVLRLCRKRLTAVDAKQEVYQTVSTTLGNSTFFARIKEGYLRIQENLL